MALFSVLPPWQERHCQMETPQGERSNWGLWFCLRGASEETGGPHADECLETYFQIGLEGAGRFLADWQNSCVKTGRLSTLWEKSYNNPCNLVCSSPSKHKQPQLIGAEWPREACDPGLSSDSNKLCDLVQAAPGPPSPQQGTGTSNKCIQQLGSLYF